MITVRVWFTKVNEAAYISLLDLQRVMGRAIKCSRIPAWYSLGFNPHLYLTFAAPLALGHESMVESMDFKTEAENFDFEKAKTELSKVMPSGMQVLKIEKANMPADKIAFAEYKISWSDENIERVQNAINIYNESDSAPIEKKTKRGVKTIDLKEHINSIELMGNTAVLLLPAGNVLNINPELLLIVLAKNGGVPVEDARVLRVALLTADKENFS
ncbi:MAG: TIGR03936 family radical SAM-associated protein [Oscillospiraceae bacterium]